MLHSVQFAPMINSQVFEQYFGFKHTDQGIAREQEDSAILLLENVENLISIRGQFIKK